MRRVNPSLCKEDGYPLAATAIVQYAARLSNRNDYDVAYRPRCAGATWVAVSASSTSALTWGPSWIRFLPDRALIARSTQKWAAVYLRSVSPGFDELTAESLTLSHNIWGAIATLVAAGAPVSPTTGHRRKLRPARSYISPFIF